MKILFCVLLLILNTNYFNASNKIKFPENDGLISTNDFSSTPIKRSKVIYTQGIFFTDNGRTLIESGGLYGESSAVKMEYPSLRIVKNVPLESGFFGEGIARCGDFVYQLTWRERVVLKYSYNTMDLVDKLTLASEVREGWGLSSGKSSDELIASDGSSKIYYLDCNNSLSVKKSINVSQNNVDIDRINALCFAKGYIWANRYYDKNIFKIDPISGHVVKTYDMTDLITYELDNFTLTNERLNSGEVLNGIAYDITSKKFLITGKKWGYYYLTNFK
jgi:glutamine cyclotransferase